LEAYEDYSALKASDLKMRIEEMLRIKGETNFSGNKLYWHCIFEIPLFVLAILTIIFF
jgi:hypothetical protein